MKSRLLLWTGILGLLQVTACIKSGQGFLKDNENIVTIGAGRASIGGGNAFLVWYFVDRATQTCWIRLGLEGGPAALDCCNLRRVKEAASYIAWETDASCAVGAQAPSP